MSSILRGSAVTAILIGLGACGGGGSDGFAGADLAFSVRWEQPAPTAAAPSPSRASANFGSTIPASVGAIRFLLTTGSGDDARTCCIAVLRDSATFEERSLALADVTPGLATLRVDAYPFGIPPSGGATSRCATRPEGAGSACAGSGNPLSSFGSNPLVIDVVAGETNRATVDVFSRPFLLDLDPADGQAASSARPQVTFTAVDAVHTIDPEPTVGFPAVGVQAPVFEFAPCSDRPADALPLCSADGSLDVRGARVLARSAQTLPAGPLLLRVTASNTGTPARTLVSDTLTLVPPDTTTTTSTTSTTSTSTTTTSTSTSSTTTSTTSTTTTSTTTTTTTLPPPVVTCLGLVLANEVELAGLSFQVTYKDVEGDFRGTGATVECELRLPGAIATFNDQDAERLLNVAVAAPQGFPGPVELAACIFESPQSPDLGAFGVTVVEATAPDLSPADADVIVEETACPN
jgi:hypothetical protein